MSQAPNAQVEPTRAPRIFELVDYQGKLAIHVDTSRDRKSPELVTRYYVSNCPAGDFYYKSLIGRQLHGDNSRASYTWRDNGTIVYVDYHDWESVEIRVPVAKPRDGKEYTWKWSEHGESSCGPGCGPGWEKDYFPACPTCGKYHNPAFEPCEICGHCHKPGSKCPLHECWNCGAKHHPTSDLPYYCSEECKTEDESHRLTWDDLHGLPTHNAYDLQPGV